MRNTNVILFTKKGEKCYRHAYKNKDKKMELSKKFKYYFLKNNITMREFADKVGVHKVYLCRIVNGHLFPGKKLLEEIEAKSGKEIKKSDFVKAWKLKKLANNLDENKHENQRENDK